jgi:hypothetical protein
MLKTFLLRQLGSDSQAIFIQIDSGGVGSLTGRPTGDVAEAASKFHETVPRHESCTQKQIASPTIVNFTNYPKAVVIAAPGAQQVLVANRSHEGRILSNPSMWYSFERASIVAILAATM